MARNKTAWRVGIGTIFVLMAILMVLNTGCAGFATVRVRRDIDTTGYEYQAVYTSGGGKVENQGVLITDAGGLDLANLAFFSTTAGTRTEILQRFNPSKQVNEPLWRMTQYSTSEDIFDIREASFIVQRLIGTDNVDLLVIKSEMSFGFSLLLNKINNQDFEISCLYTAEIGKNEKLTGEEIAARAKPWFTKLTYKTIFSERFSPYCVSITDTKIGKVLPANWAQMNEAYDEAIGLARELVKNLEQNGWESLSPEQGRISRIVENPTYLLDIIKFESPYGGRIYLPDGTTARYRIVPGYNLFHLNNLDWWWGKQNSRNRSLESLVIEVEENGEYAPKAIAYFIKSRWAKNGLYVFDRIGEGETPGSILQRGYDLINMDIPEDVLAAMKRQDSENNKTYHKDIDTILEWTAKRPPFDLRQLNADFAAVVDIANTTEVLTGTSGDKSVTVSGVKTMTGTYHICGDPNTVVYFNSMLGEHAVEMLDLGYIQPKSGDGIGFVSTIIRLVERYNSGTVNFNDAALLDQRAQESPEMIGEALRYFTTK